MLLASSPLKCLCPADVYLLLKSSDFISHDLSEETVFEGCEPPRMDSDPPYALELVLRKWYPVDRSREFRCFVRQDLLLGVFDHIYSTQSANDNPRHFSARHQLLRFPERTTDMQEDHDSDQRLLADSYSRKVGFGW